ncbi:MAG: hypothetical protein ACTHMD_15720 [Flavisolibacter sp.]
MNKHACFLFLFWRKKTGPFESNLINKAISGINQVRKKSIRPEERKTSMNLLKNRLLFLSNGDMAIIGSVAFPFSTNGAFFTKLSTRNGSVEFSIKKIFLPIQYERKIMQVA